MIARRGDEKPYAGYWEFPGGKIEKGETPEVCVKREFMEELGIRIGVRGFIGHNTYTYSKGPVQVFLYSVQYLGGTIAPTEHAEIRWVKPEELVNFELLPGNLILIPHLANLKV